MNRFHHTEIINHGSGVQCKRFYKNSVLLDEIWFKNDVQHRDGDEPVSITYFENELNQHIECLRWLKNGKQHRENNLPAVIWFHPNGNKKEESWFVNGDYFRENDLPCIIEYFEDNTISKEIWNKANWREGDKPSSIEYYENGNKRYEEWFENYLKSRGNDKPSSIFI